jgi:hypothetical protein
MTAAQIATAMMRAAATRLSGDSNSWAGSLAPDNSCLSVRGPRGFMTRRRRLMTRAFLFQVGLERFDQFFGTPGTAGVGFMRGVDHVMAYVTLENLGHQALHGAARGSHQMQHLGAALFLIQCAFERINLSADASDAVEQAGFFANRMGHEQLHK